MSEAAGLEGESAEVRRLIEDQHQLSELQQHPGWNVYTRYALEWLEAHQNRLMGGQIDDLQEYKLVAGRTDGIRQLLQLPATVAGMLEAARNRREPWQDDFTDSFAPSGREYDSVTVE